MYEKIKYNTEMWLGKNLVENKTKNERIGNKTECVKEKKEKIEMKPYHREQKKINCL